MTTNANTTFCILKVFPRNSSFALSSQFDVFHAFAAARLGSVSNSGEIFPSSFEKYMRVQNLPA